MEEETFTDDKTYLNVELGAGCGNFGKLYYEKCYLTDNDLELKSTCTTCYIDVFCSAYDLKWADDRFDKIIMCNPQGYGFKDNEMTHKLMTELLRVLNKEGGEIIIICGNISTYCNPRRVRTRVNTFLENNKNSYKLTYNHQKIDPQVEYPNYIFRKKTLGEITVPTNRITINVR